ERAVVCSALVAPARRGEGVDHLEQPRPRRGLGDDEVQQPLLGAVPTAPAPADMRLPLAPAVCDRGFQVPVRHAASNWHSTVSLFPRQGETGRLGAWVPTPSL